MAIVGFNFTKINVERKEMQKGKINISNNVAIKDVKPTDISLGKEKQDALKFTFEFTSRFEPKIGSILLGGDLLYLGDANKIKEVNEGWKKDKRVPKEIMGSILNTILAKCNIQALILSQEVNLPPPVPLPKVEIGTPEKQYIG